MSLFQFGFNRVVQQQVGTDSRVSGTVVPHLPSINESGLGMVEYREVTRAVSDLSDPSPAKKKIHEVAIPSTHLNSVQI